MVESQKYGQSPGLSSVQQQRWRLRLEIPAAAKEFFAMTGTIKKIMRQKGYGFITPDDGREDVFFHRGSLAPRNQNEYMKEGDTVQFQTRKGEKGPVAFDLKIR
jgi:cold shock protein